MICICGHAYLAHESIKWNDGERICSGPCLAVERRGAHEGNGKRCQCVGFVEARATFIMDNDDERATA